MYNDEIFDIKVLTWSFQASNC